MNKVIQIVAAGEARRLTSRRGVHRFIPVNCGRVPYDPACPITTIGAHHKRLMMHARAVLVISTATTDADFDVGRPM